MSRPDAGLDWAPDDPICSRLVLVSGAARASTVDQLTPAIELYDGGCLPQLRARLGDHPHHRARVRILCAGHGVVRADTPMFADHHVVTGQRSAELRPYVRERLLTEFARDGVPREVLVLAEPLYAQLVVDIFWIPGLRPHTALHTTVPDQHWQQAAAVLDRWGWP
jgi:hypothetical protein